MLAAYGDTGGPETWTKPAALTADRNGINSNSNDDVALAYGNSTNGTGLLLGTHRHQHHLGCAAGRLQPGRRNTPEYKHISRRARQDMAAPVQAPSDEHRIPAAGSANPQPIALVATAHFPTPNITATTAGINQPAYNRWRLPVIGQVLGIQHQGSSPVSVLRLLQAPCLPQHTSRHQIHRDHSRIDQLAAAGGVC